MALLIIIAAAVYLVGFYRWVLRGSALAAHAANARVPWETRTEQRANVAIDFVAQLLARVATYHLRLAWLGVLLWLGYLAYDEWTQAWTLTAWVILAVPIIHQLIVIWRGAPDDLEAPERWFIVILAVLLLLVKWGMSSL